MRSIHVQVNCFRAMTVILLLAFSSASAQTRIVDNTDSGFSILSGGWSTGSFGTPYNGDYRWASVFDASGVDASVEWRPNLPAAGMYEVSVYYVAGGNRADDVTFTVHHNAGHTPISVNQQINGETWNVLGTYSFNAGTSGSVSMDNDAGPSVVVADAVRFVRTTVTTYDLTMAVSPSGWGTTTPANGSTDTYLEGELVNILASPASGYEFSNWTVSSGVPVDDPFSASTTVTVDADKTVTAVFVEAAPVPAEFRAFWADAFHVGFKSTSQIDTMVSRAVAGNYNAIIAEVLAYQDAGTSAHGAYWNSSIVPKATDVSGGIDPLAYLVQQAHAQGIEVHTWLVTFRVSKVWPPSGNTILSAHPEWLAVSSGDQNGGPAKVNDVYTLDPGSPDAQAYLLSIVDELVSNYDIDGVHWDYIRYTTTDSGYPADNSYAKSSLARFQDITGYVGSPTTTGNTAWDDFRRHTITELVRRSQVLVAAKTDHPQPIRHSAALITWGNAPSNFANSGAYGVFQNWRLWMEEGFLDTAVPMTYFDETVYPTWYRHWVDQQLLWAYGRHVCTGPGIYLNTFANSLAQIDYARNAGVDGISTYSYAVTEAAGTNWNWYDYMATNVFTEPAPTPNMPWRDPAIATEGAFYGRVADGVTGEPFDHATIKINGFAVAETDGNGFYVITRLPAPPDGIDVPMSASVSGQPEVSRPFVLLEPAGYTEANFGIGSWLPGDYDVDGVVDAADSAKFLPCLTGPGGGPLDAGCDVFDFDLDGDIDLYDLQLYQEAFGGA